LAAKGRLFVLFDVNEGGTRETMMDREFIRLLSSIDSTLDYFKDLTD